MKINLCCGMDYRENYINVDFSDVGSNGKKLKVDLTHDVLTGLPWEDGQVDELVFRESLEHFNREQGMLILKEIHRVLKPGGKLDLSVPNAVRQLKMLIAFAERPVTLEQWTNPHSPPWGWPKYHEDLMGATHKDSLGDSHLTLYNSKLLQAVLIGVGFQITSLQEYSSLYVEATK